MALDRRRERRQDWSVAGLLGLALLAGCGSLTMKLPESKAPLTRVEVKGHTPSLSYRDSDLRMGRFRVGEVSGTPILPPGLTAYGRLPEQTEWKYQYTVKDDRGQQLRGECKEQVGEVRYFGLGETTLDVHCRCFTSPKPIEGEKPAADVWVQRGQGKAWIAPSHRFAVFGTRTSEQGKRSRAILGYRFQSGSSLGAVDVTKRAAVYASISLPPQDELPLACLYAGLLLHRPNR